MTRVDTRLREILDELAGISGDRLAPPAESESVEPVPLSDGFADRTLRRIRALSAGTTAPVTKPRWWLRPAAVIPLGVVVLLAGGSPFLYRWVGRSFTRVPYEHCVISVLDMSYPAVNRSYMQGRIGTVLRRSIVALEAAAKDPLLEAEATRVLTALTKLVQAPDLARAGVFPHDSTERLLGAVTMGSKDRQAALRAIPALLEPLSAGIEAIYRCRNDPDPSHRRNTVIRWNKLRTQLGLPPSNDVGPPPGRRTGK